MGDGPLLVNERRHISSICNVSSAESYDNHTNEGFLQNNIVHLLRFDFVGDEDLQVIQPETGTTMLRSYHSHSYTSALC